MKKAEGERTKPYKYGEKERARRMANRAERRGTPMATMGPVTPQSFSDAPDVSTEGSGARSPPTTLAPQTGTEGSGVRSPPSTSSNTSPNPTRPVSISFGLANVFRENYPGVSGASEGMTPVAETMPNETSKPSIKHQSRKKF